MKPTNWVSIGDSIEIFGYQGVPGRAKDGSTVWHITGYVDVRPWKPIPYILDRAPQYASKIVVVSPQMAVQLYLAGGLPHERLEASVQTATTIRCIGVRLGGEEFQLIIDRRLEPTPNRIS